MEAPARPARTAHHGALSGLKVIDLSRILGGPYCTMILGDHGADVIKLEPPQGDDTRNWGPPFADDADHTASYYIGVNRNKRSVGLDLTKPGGRDVLLALLDGADVLVENFKPGAMERWGLGYERDLAPRFPRLVHCRVSGFGASGPLGGMPGYDAIIQAMTGLMSVNGDQETGPLRLGTPVVDLATGLYATIAILMALHERAGSGRGQFIDMTLYDCGLALLHPQAANYFMSGRRPVGLGNPHPNIAPYAKYATATCEIFLAIGNERQFARLAAELGRPDLAQDPRFKDNATRIAHRPALIAALSEIFAREDGYALSERLIHAGLPVGPVLAIDEAAEAPHTKARQMVESVGGHRVIGTPIKFSRTPGDAALRAPPAFGADTEAVLAEAGYSAPARAELRASGVLPGARRRQSGP